MVTIVTCLFDLKKRENTGRRDINFYIKNSKILELDENLVIYCDLDLVSQIRKIRKNDKTLIIPIDLENIPTYKYIPRLVENNKINKIKDANPVKDSVLYTVVQLSKYYFMKQITKYNPFSTKYFSWMDFGINYVADFTYINEALNYRPEKFRAVVMNYPPFVDKEDSKYYTILAYIVAGGFSLAPRDIMKKHSKLFIKETERAINAGYSPLDEQVLGRLMSKYPELYEEAYGDFKSIFSNFAGTIRLNPERKEKYDKQKDLYNKNNKN